ncbi:hypothetical protein UFOVP257_432 [uncultured Caudovirales phage]|uniref:Uncharacterized protein n=1 Tax=uncultured Caudovirales phage TaxID=2100421 RepID=A0A6J5LLA0_9CAUD|nr:hypothetical protein UFOVP257_432 [uncultured Caudovirales phage]
MTYAQGGLITAGDYNTLVGANTSVTGTDLNSAWAWGANSRGWGQSVVSLASVNSADLITATQWASLVNTLNSANTHINGSSSGLTANTAGQIIGYSGSLQTKINGVNTDRLLFNSNSAVVVGSALAYAAWTSTTTTSTLTRAFGARATFTGGADKARFFFNAGGRMKFNITATTTGGAGSRGAAALAVVDNLGGVALFAANTNGGRTGTGGTAGTNDTALGYYTSVFNANTSIVATTSTTTNYTSDTGTIAVKPNGSQGSFGSNGDSIDFWATINSTSGGNSGGSFDDSLSLTPTVSIDISYPEVTNISNTWGAITVTQL